MRCVARDALKSGHGGGDRGWVLLYQESPERRNIPVRVFGLGSRACAEYIWAANLPKCSEGGGASPAMADLLDCRHHMRCPQLREDTLTWGYRDMEIDLRYHL